MREIYSLIANTTWKVKHMAEQHKPKSSDALFLYKLELTDRYRDPTNWDVAATAIVEQHKTFLDDLGKQGILVFAGRTLFNPGDKDLFSIAVIIAPDLETAQQIMATDPAVVNNIQQATMLPFSIGTRYFKNLNGKEKPSAEQASPA